VVLLEMAGGVSGFVPQTVAAGLGVLSLGHNDANAEHGCPQYG
jgi:hypothetical protein